MIDVIKGWCFMKINKFMKAAIKEAYKGIENGDGGPFGAVIVKDGKIISKGHNMVLKNNDCTCHGEMMAIRNACKKLKTYDLSGCEIYTTGEPCPMCRGAIQWANITKCYHACNYEDTNEIGFRDDIFHKNPLQSIELNRDEGKKLYEDYVNKDVKRY